MNKQQHRFEEESANNNFAYPSPAFDIEGQQKTNEISPLSEDVTRLGLIRKIYGILSVQLLITFFMTALPMVSSSITHFIQNTPFLLIISLLAIITISIALLCARDLARSYPTNYILLFAFTVAEAYSVAAICSMYPPRIVLIAAALTAGVTLTLTLYACTTKTDFSYCGGFLFVASFFLLVSGICLLFAPSYIMELIYSGLGVIIYSIYLIYDTQLIVGGDHYFKLSTDDYIVGALIIYIDIVVLFLRILRIVAIIFGERK